MHEFLERSQEGAQPTYNTERGLAAYQTSFNVYALGE